MRTLLVTLAAAAGLALVAVVPAQAGSCGESTTANGLGITQIRTKNVSCTTGRRVARTATARPSALVRSRFTVGKRTWRCRATEGTSPRARCTAGRGVVTFRLSS